MKVSLDFMRSSMGKTFFLEDAKSKNKTRQGIIKELEGFNEELIVLSAGKEVTKELKAVHTAKQALKMAEEKYSRVAGENLHKRNKLLKQTELMQGELAKLTPISINYTFDRLKELITSNGVLKPEQSDEVKLVSAELMRLAKSCIDDTVLLTTVEKLDKRLDLVFN